MAGLPAADPAAPVRLWVDRAFTIKGAGTVVTGTLAAGTLTVGDELELAERTVRVRGLHSLGSPAATVAAPARVAVNLRHVEKAAVPRGAALLTPGRFLATALVDVRVHGDPVAGLPATVTLHIGSAAVPARVRPLGPDTARLRLGRALPLRVGDRALLRDPGRHHVAGGVTVLDVVPPGLDRRGAAAARARVLAELDGTPSLEGELRRRGLARSCDLARMGVPVGAGAAAWLLDPAHERHLADRLTDAVRDYVTKNPLETGIPLEALRHTLGLPDRSLLPALVRPPLLIREGRVLPGTGTGLPAELTTLLDEAFAGLAPFTAPEANRLTALGLDPRRLAAAVRAGVLVRLEGPVFLRAGAPEAAAAVLAALPQPFTLSEARQALTTTRRVAVPLLAHLDRTGATERLLDDRRTTR